MRNKVLYLSLSFFVFIGLFADFLANDKPILIDTLSGYEFPIFKENYKINKDDKIVVNPLIHYSQYSIDYSNAGYVSPFAVQNLSDGQQRHFLGTDQMGRDVLAGIIHGTSIALKVGVLSMFLAFVIGLLMSLYSSYFGDGGFRRSVGDVIFYIVLFFTFTYFLFYFDTFSSLVFASKRSAFIFVIVLLIILLLLFMILNKITFFRKQINLPLDSFFSLLTKLFQSLPGSFLILILISLFAKPSIYNIIFVIAILKWPVIARYIRVEMLKIKEEKFIESSRAVGLKDNLIIWRHILPHILTSVIVALSFGFAGTILLESTLSFLGIGIPADYVSWGSLLSAARHNFSAWWLAIFPGLAIFLTILMFNTIGNKWKY